MRAVRFWLAVATGISVSGCQSIQEKDAALIQDRVEKLLPLSKYKSMKCELKTELSAPQAVKYRAAFPDETSLIENWDVSYDWKFRPSRCEVHAKPLTPMTANQRAFVEEAMCTLFQVFWEHSPFDGLHLSPKEIVDQDQKIFLQQNPKSELGIYVSKGDVELETRTAHKGILFARYQQQDGKWLPVELRRETATFSFAIRDIKWPAEITQPPEDFWIFVGEQGPAQAHTRVHLAGCR